MQNKFSREFVEQKDRECKERESIVPQRVEIPEITGEKHGCEYPNMEWLVIKVFIFAAVVSVLFFVSVKLFS